MENSLPISQVDTVIAMMAWIIALIPTEPVEVEKIPKKLRQSVENWVEQLFKRSQLLPSVLVVAFIYLCRFRSRNPGITMFYGGGHRLCFTALMMASKYLDDEAYSNDVWGKIAFMCFKLGDVNKMELEFMCFLDHNLHVELKEYMLKLDVIETEYLCPIVKLCNKRTVSKHEQYNIRLDAIETEYLCSIVKLCSKRTVSEREDETSEDAPSEEDGWVSKKLKAE